MSVGYSTNLQLVEPITGTESGNWGYDINYGTTDYIDIAISGTNTITTDGDVTLAQTTGSTSGNNIVGTTAQYYILNCTGARTANRNIIAPAISKTYYVINATTTATTPFTITIKKSGGTGVTIPPGAAALVAYNGTDFQAINAITGVLGFNDTNLVISAQASANTYVQGVIQNTSSGTAASADFIVANNLSTATTYYGDFGINSSTFSGTGSLSAANATYVTATSGDLALGTTTSNAIHFVVNSGATDAMTIASGGGVSFPTTGAITLPVGTTAQEPASSVAGMLRFNSTTGQFEGYSQQQTLSSVAVTGTAGQCSCTATTTTLVAGQAVVVSGTLTGTETGITAGTYYVIGTPTSTTFQLSATPGGAGVTTTAGTTVGLTFLAFNWSSVGGAAISNDTTTSTAEYPLFASATSGTALTVYTSNAKLLYKPSTGDYTSSQFIAGNGLFLNTQTIATSYTIPTGYSAHSAGPITLSSGVSVTLGATARWVVL
jgi:hypothetical protein